MPPSNSLSDEDTLEEISRRLRQKLEADPLLQPMFDGVDMSVLSRKHHLFFTMLFLGNTPIVTDKLRQAHHRIQTNGGITEEHFNAFVAHIMDACNEMDVSKADMERISHALEDVKPAIVP